MRISPPALPLLLAAALAASAPQTRAGDDHERARAALQAGEILPLKTVLDQLARSYPGQVMKVEIERESDRWIYEIKLLQSDGRLSKLKLDAQTGALLSMSRKHERR